MYRRGRSEVSVFDAKELLYRRYQRSGALKGKIPLAALKTPTSEDSTGHSVNRSLFSKPEDVLWKNGEKLNGWGVFQFPVSCVPADRECPRTKRRFAFFLKHVPLSKNYSHSEIWIDELPSKGGVYVVPTKEVWKEVRALIQKNSCVVIEAEV